MKEFDRVGALKNVVFEFLLPPQAGLESPFALTQVEQNWREQLECFTKSMVELAVFFCPVLSASTREDFAKTIARNCFSEEDLCFLTKNRLMHHNKGGCVIC